MLNKEEVNPQFLMSASTVRNKLTLSPRNCLSKLKKKIEYLANVF